eukprot:COSAG01_NODE_15643_length_1315_cov_3.977796_2_plen_39_part_00
MIRKHRYWAAAASMLLLPLVGRLLLAACIGIGARVAEH